MGRPIGSRSQICLEREKQVIVFRGDGYSNRETAEGFNVSLAAVEYAVRILIKEGKIERRKPGMPQRNRPEREQLITDMTRERATLQEIGEAMGGLTKQRVSQLVSSYNLSIPLSDSRYCTTPEAAKILHVGQHDIAKFCQEGKLPFRRRGESSSYLIPRKDIEGAKGKIAMMRGREKTCVVCGRMFVIQTPTGAKRKKCYSKQCLEKYEKKRREACFRSAPTVESLRGKPRMLFEKLGSISCRTLPDNERWLAQAEASRETGITASQLNWLRRRQILTARPHPTKRWRNQQPAALYAASELEIARKVYGAV